MRLTDRGQRNSLRAKLLLGVAGAAAASSAAFADETATATAPPAPNKWTPYSDIGGSVGSGMAAGKLDFFVPLFQNMDSLVFLNLGVGTETKANVLYNIGLGYRTKIDSEWIVGVYAGHDGTQLNDNNTFAQTSFGAELMSADWDARLNGYLAESGRKQVPGQSGLYINGTTIAVLDGEDVGYSGFDGEVGYRVFSTDTMDVRVFVGGFHFSHDASDRMSTDEPFDFNYRDMTGPKARAEVTLYDLDELGNQSRLTLNAEISHDDARGTTGNVGATLRIPLGNFSGGGGAQALDELDRRMTDPERRNDSVLTRMQFTKPEPVIIYGAGFRSQPTNTLLYVDNTLGIGTYANPTTLADATARHTTNAFIVLTSKQLPIMGGATMQPGQTIVAGGETFTVEGEFSHTKFTHLFDPSTNVTLIPAAPGGNVLTLASNTNIYGFNIKGNFGDAIYAKNVDNVTIGHITIDGTGGGHNGIDIAHTVSGEEIVGIDSVAISNLTGSGINIHSNITDGGTSTEKFTISNVTVANAFDGISISNYVGAGSKVTSSIAINNATISDVSYDGIYVGANAYGTGSTFNRTLTISNTAITNAGDDGIVLSSYAGGGAHVATNDTLTGITVSGSYYAGVASYAHAYGAGSTLSQTLDISQVSVTGGAYNGLVIEAQAIYGATVNQTASISGATVTNTGANAAYGRGIGIYAEAIGTGAKVYQTATITDANVSYITGGIAGEGFSVNALALAGGAVVQSVSIDPSSSTHNGFGLSVEAYAYDFGHGVTTIDQQVTVSGTAAAPSNFSYNSDGGVSVEAIVGSGQGGYTSQAAISQSVSISNAVIDHNFNGAVAFVGASNGASATQNVYLSNVDISHNTHYGVWIEAYAESAGFAGQNITISGASSSYSQISNNGSDGIFIKDEATEGGLIQQNIGVYFTDVDHNSGDGVRVENYAGRYLNPAPGTYLYSHISQNLSIEYGSISSNAGHGVEINNTVNYGAQIDQFVYLYGETIDNNGGHGFIENSVVTTYTGGGFSLPTNLHSDVYIVNSDVSNNALSGIEFDATLQSPTYPAITIGYSYLEQHITVANTTVNSNAGSGFVATTHDSGVYGDNLAYITLASSTFSHNGVDGASFYATQNYGPGSFGAAIQEITISGSTFSNNVRDGLYAYAQASGQQGRAEQHFTISGSTFDYNGRNGATFEAYAHDGVYLTGFGCGQIQGLSGGCAIVRQTVSIVGSDFSHNTADGIYAYAHANNYGTVYNDSGRPAYTPTMLIENSTIDYNGGDGLHIKTAAGNNSYVYSYEVSVNAHFDHNAGNGISVSSAAYTGSAIIQNTVLYGTGATSLSTADHNGGAGIYVSSYVNGGAINQRVGVYNSDVSYNGAGGVSVDVLAVNPTGGAPGAGYVVDPTVSALSQYVNVDGSTVLGNTGYGVQVTSRAVGNKSAIYQYLGVVGSTISGNTGDGVHAFEIAYSGASANQSLYFNNDTITNNLGDGVYAVEIAVNQSSTNQTVNFGYQTGYTTNITGNHGDGIYIGAAAFSGANAIQTAFVYDVNASSNQGNGLALGLGSNGYGFGNSYIYYSHVSQNLITAYSTFDHNGLNGINVANTLYYGGAANQLIQVVGVDASHNAGSGFNETSIMTTIRGNSFSFSTNITTDLYLINSTFNQNTGGDGIAITAHLNGPTYAPAFFGGYSYMIQHTQISGSTADGNSGDGLLLDAQQSGRYGADLQYVTISGSEFNHNTGNGARFLSTSYYGPGGFGVTLEQIGIDTSKFSYNGGNGLQFGAYASGRQGRAEQHVTVTGSYADHNTGDGVHIYASAINGTYVAGLPCTVVQGLPGGCAFVRQNFTIEGTDISHNTGNGVSVTTYANNYGAIYGLSGRPHSPTIDLYGDTINYNGNRGVDVSNHASGHSYLYQYVAMIDTHLDHNQSDGVYSASYVGGASTMLQRVLLYSYHTGASASYNGGNGFKSTIETLGGSYGRDVNIVEGVNLSHNGAFGFDGAVAYADGASTGLQINAVYFNHVNYNGDGVGLYSIGAGAQQISYIGGNDIGHNSFVGVYGEANFGAFQYVGVYTFGNTVANNGTNYLFNAFGGSTQVLN